MKKYVILTSSLILILMGFLIEDRGLAMQVTEAGETLHPISSGSEDGLFLKSGLYMFALTAFYSMISIIKGYREMTLFVVYSVNSLIYAFLLFLAMLDSSIIEAARPGDWPPLFANIIWILSFVIYAVLSLNKTSQPTPKSGAAEL